MQICDRILGSDLRAEILFPDYYTNNTPLRKRWEEILIASNMYGNSQEYVSLHDPIQVTTLSGQTLYAHLLSKLETLGPVHEVKKSMSITLENCKPFASVMIRGRSLKLVFRLDHKITSPRIFSHARVADKSFDHTILLESRSDMDAEVLKWLGEAYQNSK